jgi:hypothetical protein
LSARTTSPRRETRAVKADHALVATLESCREVPGTTAHLEQRLCPGALPDQPLQQHVLGLIRALPPSGLVPGLVGAGDLFEGSPGLWRLATLPPASCDKPSPIGTVRKRYWSLGEIRSMRGRQRGARKETR